MSKYSDYLKSRKLNDLKYFFGEDLRMISNQYFKFRRVIDENHIIIITRNVELVNGKNVLIIDNNKGVYLKEWQVRKVKNYFEGIEAFAVKLDRNWFKPYEFKFQFYNYDFEKEITFDELLQISKEQDEKDLEFALN